MPRLPSAVPVRASIQDGPKRRVQLNATIRNAGRAAAGLVAVATFAVLLTSAYAVVPPHVPDSASTDSCAMCHRTHTADAVVPHRSADATETTGTSLIIASDPARGDVSLCFTCHGVGQLGSNSDVESAFSRVSVHSLAPSSSPYGPSPLYCSTCHDSHGTDRTASGTPYPALLRSYSIDSTQPVFTGESYCATCHTARPDERFDGLAVFTATAHYSGLAMPASGTGIRCSICHDPHGSRIAPLLVGSLVPTSVASTFTVTADDRSFCVACHTAASATWPGGAAYGSSSHAASSKTVTITARWVPSGQRKVGECQACHAPMGRSDGAGGAIPKLVDAKGRALCDRCHAPGGVASTDTSSEAYPASASSAPELVAVYAASLETSSDGRVSVYGRALSGASPRPLIGPRQYAPSLGTGPAASGDIEGDGTQKLIVASAHRPEVSIYAPDSLTGLSLVPTVAPVPAGVPITSMAVADFVPNGFGWIADTPEIAAVTGDGRLVIYRWTGSVLATVGVPVSLPAGPWALATGDVTGTAYAEAVVTDASGGSITIASEDGAGGIVATTTPVGVSPVAPSVGRVWSDAPAGRLQIAVGDSASATATVRVLDGSGTELAGYLVTPGDGKPTASAVGDVLPTAPSAGLDELSVAFADASGDSSIVVFSQRASGAGLDTPSAVERATGAGFGTGRLLVGDVDGDGRNELVAGNGGTWSRTNTAVAPSFQVFRATSGGDSLAASLVKYAGGGAEMAGSAPSLALADFGPVLPSRHPIDEVAASAHVSTETAPFARHVTCSDCHDVHVAATGVTTAPAIQSLLAGALGVTVSYPGGVPHFGTPAPSATGYGVCFKCHSSYAALDGRPDLAAQFDPANASVHAIEAESTSTVAAATFVEAAPAWDSSSVLQCSDCHGDDGRSGAQARGVHTSSSAPILGKPYLGVVPGDTTGLCYGCHRADVFATGAADGAGMSAFVSAGGDKHLHAVHVGSPASGGHGLSCSACHVAHGSVTLPHLLRDDIGVTPAGAHGGSCTNACHAGTHVWP
jgi:predicted CXXCH cytochrome family protein